MGYAAQNRNP